MAGLSRAAVTGRAACPAAAVSSHPWRAGGSGTARRGGTGAIPSGRGRVTLTVGNATSTGDEETGQGGY